MSHQKLGPAFIENFSSYVMNSLGQQMDIQGFEPLEPTVKTAIKYALDNLCEYNQNRINEDMEAIEKKFTKRTLDSSRYVRYLGDILVSVLLKAASEENRNNVKVSDLLLAFYDYWHADNF
jgi:hypothetical protein